MSTSNSYDFTTTRNELIADALRLLGVVAEGGTPTSDQYSTGAEALNLLLKEWETAGLPIWAIKKQSISLSASTASYTIGLSQTVNVAKPLRIYQAYLHDTSSSVDVPMVRLSQEEYNRLGNKTSEGNPVNYYYENLRTTGTIYFFPTPDSTAASGKTVEIVYQAPFQDFDSSTDEPDVPQELMRALKFNLAADLAWDYGYPIKDRQLLMMKAEALKQEAFSFVQEEASLFFGIERRSY